MASLRASKPMMTTAIGPIPHVLPEGAIVEGRISSASIPAWVTRCLKRDGQAILRMLWRILGCEADVMDAYQDCFCKLATCNGGRRPKHATAYAYRTAVNIAVGLIRSRTRRNAHWPAIVAERARADDGGTRRDSDRLTTMRAAIAQLPPHLRNVVALRDLNGMPYAQVGTILGINAATARVYRRHAIVKLAEVLNHGAQS